MSQIDDFLSGRRPQDEETSGSSIEAFLSGGQPQKKRERRWSVEEQRERGARDVAADLGKGFGGAAISAVGAIPVAVGRAIQEGGETLFGLSLDEAQRLAEAEGTPEKALEWYERANRLNPLSAAGRAIESGGRWMTQQGDRLREARSDEAKELARQSTPGGDITQPSTWTLGENPTVEGVAQVTADVLGSMAPPVATAIATRGRSATTQMRAGGAAVAGQIGGAAMEEASDYLEQFSDEQLRESSPVFRDLEARGYSAADARAIIERQAQNRAAIFAAPVGHVGGQATGALLGKSGKRIAGGLASTPAKMGFLGALGATEEGLQEVSEGVATRAGIRDATGIDRSLTEGTFGEFVLGAKGGGVIGAGKGLIEGVQSRGQRAAPGPITDDGTTPPTAPAITPETSNTPPSAPVAEVAAITPQSTDPTARLAELEILAEQRDLTPAEREEAAKLLATLSQDDALAEAGASPAPAAREVDPIQQELDYIDTRLDVITPANGYGPVFDQEREELAARRRELLEQQRAAQAPTVTHPAPAGDAPVAGTETTRPTQVAPTDFWSFAKSKGYKPADVKVGTPLHAELKAEFDALRNGQPLPSKAQPAAPSVDPVAAVTAWRERFPAKPPSGMSVEQLRQFAGERRNAEAQLVQQLEPQANGLVLPTATGFGGITQDPSEAGKWRITRFDAAMEPVGHEVYNSAREAIENLLSRFQAPQARQAAPILQNRNRATPSSIAQMQSIAAQPDYGRLGFSRDFANGAPVVAGGQVAPEQLGREDWAVASDGRRIPVQYAVVEAADVLPSNQADGTPNPDYGNQAVQRIRAIAGNGRIAGLQLAYRKGTTADYLRELTGDTLHGVNPDVIRGMRAPVLVRVMPSDQVTADIGDVSNTVGNLNLSAVEQANNDAQRVNLDALQFAEDGSITPEAVRQFVRAMPQAEQGGLIDTNGQPTKQAVDRINAAVFAKAYGNDQLVRLYAQAQDPEARNVLSALAQVAPKMARLEGAGALDIRGVVTQAAEIAVNARREGKALSLAARQLDMVADPDVGAVLELFARNPRSVKPVVEALGRMADMAYTEANKPAEDMFGAVPRASRTDVINQLRPENERTSPQALENPAGGQRVEQVDEGPAPEPARAAAPAEDQADGAGQAEGLTSYSQADIEQRLERLEQAQREQERADREAAETERERQQREEIRRRSEAAAARADAGQQEDSGRRAAPARGRARKAKGEGVEAETPATTEPEVKTLPSAETFKSWSTAVPKLGTVNGWTLFRDSLDGVRYVLMTPFNAVGFDTEEAARAWAKDNKATKGDFNEAKAKPAEAASEQPAIDREKLDKDFRTFPTLILNNLLERGEAAKLYKAAGVKGASAFDDLAMDDKAAAYVKFVQQGGKPVENLPKDYNAWVKSEERAAEVRRLQSDRVVRQENGKPFKSKTSAQQFQERYDLTGTHEVVAVDGGFELRQLSPAAQAELKRKAEGRESYTEAQAAVAEEMGIGQTPDGEWDATDEQFDEMERRVQARMRGEPAEPLLTNPTREDVLARQERAENAQAADEREQIRRESEAGAGMFSLETQDGRQDTTADLFRQTAAEPAQAAPAAEAATDFEQQSAIERHGLPEGTTFSRGKGMASGKWIARAGDTQGNLSATIDEAASSLAQFLQLEKRREENTAAMVALSKKVADKLRRGEQPTDAELRDLFGLDPRHTYVKQSAVGRFLVDYMGVPRNKIRESLGKAAGTVTSDSGTKYPIVYPRKLHEVFGATKAADDAPMMSRTRAPGAMTEAIVRQVVDTIKALWANAPEVVVVQNMQDMRVPEAARLEDARQRAAGATGAPRGFYYRGTVYLVADGLKSVTDAAEALFHEALGHYGLRAVFGSALDGILDQIAVARPDLMRPKAKEYGKDLKVLKQRREVAEEVLAGMAQTKPNLGFVKRAIAAIRTWLRKNVPALKDMALTDAEIINNFILPARNWVERGERAMRPGSQIALSRSAMKSVTANPDIPEQAPRPELPETIEVDGVQRPTRNSAGQLIHPTEEGIRNFWRWFGSSRVVDEQGRPLVVYHGASADFSAFDEKKLGRNTGAKSAMQGFFFASNPDLASHPYYTGFTPALATELIIWPAVKKAARDLGIPESEWSSDWRAMDKIKARMGEMVKEEQDRISKLKREANALDGRYSLLRKEVTEEARAKAKKLREEARKLQAMVDWESAALEVAYYRHSVVDEDGIPQRDAAQVFPNVMPTYLRITNPLVHDFGGSEFRDVTYADLIQQAKDEGRDGVILKNTFDPLESDIYVAFRPEQIKSATGNRGTFDPANPSVLFQRQGELDELTGLPLNPDGTVTVYHHTSADKAEAIRKTGQLKSAAEPHVYVTTRREADTGYGDTAVPIRVNPELLQIDDEFPNGRRDFRIDTGRPGGSVAVKVGEFSLDQRTTDYQSGQPDVFDWSNPGGRGLRGDFARETKIGDTTIIYGVGSNGTAEIISVRTPQAKRGAGSARRALEAFLAEADQRGLQVKLQASPRDKKTSLAKLVKFYQSLGFELTGRKINAAGDPEMVRAARNREPTGGTFDADTITVDGVSRPTRNSEGRPIHPTEEGIRNFWRWFGSSRVVDGQGRPLVVYHGTTRDFSAFDPNAPRTALPLPGIFFTPHAAIAEIYASFGKEIRDDDGFIIGAEGGNVMPVYLSLQNPARLKYDDRSSGKMTSYKVVEADMLDALNAGHDGVIIEGWADGSGPIQFVAFRPEQIKSAIGNNGQFDPENPDIRFSRSTLGNTPPTPPQNPNAWQKLKAKVLELTSPDAIESLIYEYQDKNIDLKRLRDHIKELGGTITDLNDAYLGEELYHKRLAKRTQDFLSEELKPLLADMRARGVDMPTLERYLHARHAPEANRVLAERNPNAQMIDAGKAKARAEVKALEVQLQRARAQGTATKAIEQALEQALAERDRWTGAQAFKGTEAERLSLSGMSDAEAAAFMGGLPAGQRVHLEALAARVDAMQAKTLEVLEKYGLMDKATLDAWRSTYQFYVPLHRDEAHPDAVSHPIGQGFSTKGDASKRRTGSNEKVTNILAHIAMQREAALTRGEKNRVAKKLYLMAAQNPDPEIWSVDKPPMMKTVDRETGFVRTTVDPTYRNKPNVVMVRIGGKDHAITFNERNPKAVRMAQSIKGADVGDLNAFESIMGKATRWLASVNTQYNPIFGIINFARDVQAAILQLSTTPLKGQERAVAAYVPAALKGIYAEVRSRRKGQPRGTGQWAKLWEDMQDEGGTTGYRELFITPDERVKALTKELNALERGKVSEAAHAVVDWLSDYNETMENAVRLAAYKVALDQGMSKERAASLAKNLTVNFNRRGRQTARLGAYYAFLNAAIQGTARMVETLRGPLGRKIMLGGVMLGAVNALIGMAMMGGGDGEEDNWEKIPDFVKERSLIVPLGREDYLAIPMPLGYHVFPNLGRKAVEMMMHDDPTKGVGSHIAEMLRITLDAFNPLGGSENLAQMVTPTPFDPAVALMMNRDWTGRPIYREDNSNLDPTPGHQRTKDTASAFSKAVSEALNKITGGTDYRPGAVSVTPDQIDYVIGQITGGLGREILKLENAITAPLTGDELPAYKIPLVGRLYGNTRGPASNAELFYEHVRELNKIENEIRGRARDGGDVAGYMAEEPLSALVGMGNAAENQIRKLRQYRAEVVRRAEPGYKDEVKRINEQMGEVMKMLNQEVRRAKKEARH